MIICFFLCSLSFALFCCACDLECLFQFVNLGEFFFPFLFYCARICCGWKGVCLFACPFAYFLYKFSSHTYQSNSRPPTKQIQNKPFSNIDVHFSRHIAILMPMQSIAQCTHTHMCVHVMHVSDMKETILPCMHALAGWCCVNESEWNFRGHHNLSSIGWFVKSSRGNSFAFFSVFSYFVLHS